MVTNYINSKSEKVARQVKDSVWQKPGAVKMHLNATRPWVRFVSTKKRMARWSCTGLKVRRVAGSNPITAETQHNSKMAQLQIATATKSIFKNCSQTTRLKKLQSKFKQLKTIEDSWNFVHFSYWTQTGKSQPNAESNFSLSYLANRCRAGYLAAKNSLNCFEDCTTIKTAALVSLIESTSSPDICI